MNNNIIKNFNSIKVRLELDNDQFMIGSFIFQFHKGAIRTDLAVLSSLLFVRFQFHKGAIRTEENSINSYLFDNFNSIKVRLELHQFFFDFIKF